MPLGCKARVQAGAKSKRTAFESIGFPAIFGGLFLEFRYLPSPPGGWVVTKACLPAMESQGAGSIVNISSLASRAGGFQMAYEVSKAGMNRMTQSVAMSMARRNIRCNAITPGFMDTPMAIEGIAAARGIAQDDLRAERSARVPMGRMGTGWDTAHAALFLASDEASFITGVILPVDGGQGAQIG